jgi:hypothetical protein
LANVLAANFNRNEISAGRETDFTCCTLTEPQRKKAPQSLPRSALFGQEKEPSIETPANRLNGRKIGALATGSSP